MGIGKRAQTFTFFKVERTTAALQYKEGENLNIFYLYNIKKKFNFSASRLLIPANSLLNSYPCLRARSHFSLGHMP